MRRRATSVLVVALLSLMSVACGEEEPDLSVPDREEGQVVLDEVGLLDEAVADALTSVDGYDVVAVVYETSQANAGEAHRAGGLVLDAWDADIALVAVAVPGDFESTEEDRRRFAGIRPDDPRAVPGSVIDAINDEILPVYASDNDWHGAFVSSAELLAEELE